MNILELIREQIHHIRELSSDISLEAVLVHLERAEVFYEYGKKGDDHFFTDVVYRTNQAFEGSLKQSYMILADKSEEQASSKTPNEIENFLEENEIFNTRVLHFFQNYRREWRNKSTHDFKLFFDENEAFLAIINVSAYTQLLFNQIIVRLAFLKERQLLLEEKERQKNAESRFNEGSTLNEKIFSVIKAFSLENESLRKYNELDLIGSFSAFLQSASDKLKIRTEVKLSETNYRADMIVSFGKEKTLIELKNPVSNLSLSLDQVVKYLEISNLKNGILWFPEVIYTEKIIDMIGHTYVGKDVKTIDIIQVHNFE